MTNEQLEAKCKRLEKRLNKEKQERINDNMHAMFDYVKISVDLKICEEMCKDLEQCAEAMALFIADNGLEEKFMNEKDDYLLRAVKKKEHKEEA